METENKYCLYQHITKTDGRIFYIGIGDIKRPYSNKNRNKYWNNIVKKYDYDVNILVENISWGRACKLEKIMISFYGRIDKKQGVLVNMTDGGEGSKGLILSNETKNKMSLSRKGTRLGENHPLFNIGHNEETKKKISQTRIEKSIPSPRSKKIFINGVIYRDSITASKELGIPASTIRERVRNNNFVNYKLA